MSGNAVKSVSLSSDVAGIVLVGGRSRRMGSNKALLALPGEAPLTFVERLTSLLAELCTEVLLVARDQAGSEEYACFLRRTSVRVVHDQVPDEGPLMGLYSGLQAMEASHALVLAVDLPCVRPELLAWLRAFPLDDRALVPLVQDTPQVLLARYTRSFLPLISACLAEGRRDPRALLDRAPICLLAEEQVRAVDPDLRSFLNVNTPADFQQTTAFYLP